MSDKEIIELFLNPKSVALIGASKNPMKGGYRILNNLVANNFEGKVYPVNPNTDGELFGKEIKKSVLDIDDEVDLAIFYVPNKLIPDLLSECIEKGIKGALIEASGFEEIGEAGLDLRDEILKITDNFSKIRIVGPNCMGLTRIDTDSKSKDKGGFFSSFLVFDKYKRGNIGVISQSGMVNGGYFTHLTTKYPGLGFRYIASVGNKMDLTENEFLEYMIQDDTVNVIAIYLESFDNPRRFIDLCKQAKKMPRKTIILVKGGITSEGQRATLSHTGALSESERLIKAVIQQSGAIKANSFYELFLYARTFSMMYSENKTLPTKGNLSIIVGSGGAGTILTDLIARNGLSLPELSEEAYDRLVKIFPDWMPPNRFALVDIWPAMEKAMGNKSDPNMVIKIAYDAVLGDPKIEGLFNMMFCSKQFRPMSNVDILIDIIKKNSKPVFFFLIGESKELKQISKKLSENNIPNFSNLEELVKNFQILIH
ncbi:MAG: CoA-binding protein [Promethearchaeati archaeon]